MSTKTWKEKMIENKEIFSRTGVQILNLIN